MKNSLIIVFVLALLQTQPALAHDGQPLEPHDLWNAWSWEPSIVLSLGLATWAYVRGLRALRRRTGIRPEALRWRTASFMAGMVVLFIALISPLNALAIALFSAHMVQHILLILVAAPLLILADPLCPFLLSLPWPLRRKLGQGWQQTGWLRAAWHALTQPLVVWALQTGALWAWHAPRLYQATLQSEFVHALGHLSFLAPAFLFWWVIVRTGRKLAFSVLYVFTMALQSSLLGALITFARQPWYPAYATTTQAWNLTPLEDQQLAGGIMWIPMGMIYTLAALILFMAQLATLEGMPDQRD